MIGSVGSLCPILTVRGNFYLMILLLYSSLNSSLVDYIKVENNACKKKHTQKREKTKTTNKQTKWGCHLIDPYNVAPPIPLTAGRLLWLPLTHGTLLHPSYSPLSSVCAPASPPFHFFFYQLYIP